MGDPDALLAAATGLRDAALALVQADGGVRVEDYLTALAAVTGEGALAAAGFDVAGHTLPPGSALFYEPVNEILSGDQGTIEGSPAGSVVGVLRAVAPGLVPTASLPVPDELYRHVASTVGQAEWGHVSVTVPDGNRPWLPVIQGAFQLRPVVETIEAAHGLAVEDRHRLGAAALVAALEQVAGVIDPAIGVRLAFEVTFGAAKLAPLTPAAFDAATTSTTAPPPSE